MANDLGDILSVRQRSTNLSVRSFIDSPGPKQIDRQLGKFLENSMKEEDELQLRDQRVYIYEDPEFSVVPDAVDLVIEEQCKQLKQQCIDFQRHLIDKDAEAQGNERKNRGFAGRLFRKSKTEAQIVDKSEEVPQHVSELIQQDTYSAIEGVRDAVVFAKQEWERKPRLLNGRAQACFEKCCTTMNNHINVLSLLPLDNEYFSVLCGGIKLIIKVLILPLDSEEVDGQMEKSKVNHFQSQASVNHKKVAEDFGDAIERVNSELEDCMDVCELQLTELSKLVAQLYGLIFHFLTCAMKWYKSRSIRKLLDSFNESFSDTFTPILEAIDYLKARIFRKVSYKSQAQIQKIGLSVTEILSYLREGEREKQEKRIARKKRYVTGADLNGYFDRLYERLAGDLGIQMLEANREADIYDSVDERQFVVMKDTLVAGKANRRRKSLKGMTSSKLYKRHDLQVWSRGLESHTTSMIDFLEPQSLRIDKQVANALEDWMKGTTPKTLCVCEPESSKLIAAAVAMRALEVGMPALCFFCDCTPELPMSPESRNAFYESMVVNLMYSLIRQLIDLLPNRFETKLEFTRSTFAKLDGAFDTWPRAKQVLDKLMKLAPQGMLAVIDGLDQLDLPEYHDCVEDILEILLRYTDQEHNKKRALKILLTTKESCSMIENCTTIDVISPRAAKPKHRYQNRRFLDLS